MKTIAFILLAAAFAICCLTSCKTYDGPPITGSLEWRGVKVSGTIHPTK